MSFEKVAINIGKLKLTKRKMENGKWKTTHSVVKMKLAPMALIVTLFSIPSYANDDKDSIACQAVGHFASGVSAYYFGRVAIGLDRAVALYGSTYAGTQALVQAGFQNGASGACEVAKEVWKEATEENYEKYGGGKRPGEISIGGGILGIEEECFLSTTCGDVTFTTLTNMSANQIGDLYY